MAKNNQTSSGTNIQHVKQQNAGASGQYGTEFSSQTDVQQVRQQNAKSAQKSSQASGGQNPQQ